MSDPNPFRFALLARVPLPDRGEGVIVERAQRVGKNGTRYRVRFLNASGRPANAWVKEAVLVGPAPAPKKPARKQAKRK